LKNFNPADRSQSKGNKLSEMKEFKMRIKLNEARQGWKNIAVSAKNVDSEYSPPKQYLKHTHTRTHTHKKKHTYTRTCETDV
jgi:hypothetical protein